MPIEQAVTEFKEEMTLLGENYQGPGVDDLLTKFATYLKDSGLLADCFYGI